jgi:hypothetical protein
LEGCGRVDEQPAMKEEAEEEAETEKEGIG